VIKHQFVDFILNHGFRIDVRRLTCYLNSGDGAFRRLDQIIGKNCRRGRGGCFIQQDANTIRAKYGAGDILGE